MYYILLFGLFTLAECGWVHVHNGYQKPKKPECCIEDNREILVQTLREADEIVRQYCAADFKAREVYDFEYYRLKYKFEHGVEEAIEISITHRVIRVNVKLVNGIEVDDLRIIPKSLKTQEAVWRLDGDELIVTIPYATKGEIEVPASCKNEAYEKVIRVPLSPEYKVQTLFRELSVNPTLVEFN